MLLDMFFTEQRVSLNSANVTLFWNNTEYFGTGALGGIEEATDSSGEYKNLLLSLSGVSNDLLSLALNDSVDSRGKQAQVRLAIIHPDTFEVLDTVLVFSGLIDQTPIQQGAADSIVNVSLENRGVTAVRPKPLNYTDGDQQRLYPGDTCLKTVQANSVHEDTWPAASFFRQ